MPPLETSDKIVLVLFLAAMTFGILAVAINSALEGGCELSCRPLRGAVSESHGCLCADGAGKGVRFVG